MQKNIDKETELHGDLEIDGVEYTLTQDAYLDGAYGDPHYTATAIETRNPDIEVGLRFEILDSYEPDKGDDESHACDWSVASIVWGK